MDQLAKWMLLFGLSIMVMDNSHAWTIGSKVRVNGPTIHTTYFMTPNNGIFPVHARANVGRFINNTCQYNAIYDLGNTLLKSGDSIAIDGFLLKSVIGSGYTCMTIYYTSRQLVWETFRLIFDGINYSTSLPPTSEITLL